MKKIISLILVAIMTFNLCACGSGSVQTQTKNIEKPDSDIQEQNVADVVYTGKIITMDAKGTVAEAVAVKDGRILFVGNSEDAKQYVGTNTAMQDYGENYIYPGFIDGHSHMGLVATIIGKPFFVDYID